MQRTHINPLDLTPTSIFFQHLYPGEQWGRSKFANKTALKKKKLWQGKVKAEDDPATIAWYW